MPTEAELQALLDKNAIREVVETYGRAADRRDPNLFQRMFWDEAIDDHGAYVGTAKEVITHGIEHMEQVCDSVYHSVGSIMIDLEGDFAASANVESYVWAIHILKPTADKARQLDILACRFIDRFEKRNGEWRVANRVMVRDWRHRTDLLEPQDVDAFKRGTRDDTDWIYKIGGAYRAPE
jgi:hypothetical protein